MDRSGRFLAYIFFLSLNALAAQAMVSQLSSTDQEAIPCVTYNLPPASTLQDTSLRKIIDMLSSSEFEKGLKLAQDLQEMRFYERSIKEAFINEHLIAYYNLLPDQELTTHHLSYYSTAESTGLPRSGTFVLGEAGFVVLAWKSVILDDREFDVATLDLWMLEDLAEQKQEKQPRHSMFITLGEDIESAWIPAMRIKKRRAQPVSQEIAHNLFHNETTRKAYQSAVRSSNRFLLWTPKCVQIWTVTDNCELMHEATLESILNYTDISLSPDGSHITLLSSNKENELLISLDNLYNGNEKDIAQFIVTKVTQANKEDKKTSDSSMKSSYVALPQCEVAQWSHCGRYLASTAHGKITLWDTEGEIPKAVKQVVSPEGFSRKISFELNSERRFITYLTSKNNHPPLQLHLFDTQKEMSIPLYEDSSPQSTKMYQYHEMEMSDDERFCLISVSQGNPVLVDMLKRRELRLDPNPKKYSSKAHINNITLNCATLSSSNRYALSINSNIAQIICLHAPFSSLTLVQLFLLQRMFDTETADTKKSALALLTSLHNGPTEEASRLREILRAVEKDMKLP